MAAAATRLGSGAARGSSLSTDADAVLSAAVDCLSEAKVAAPPVSKVRRSPYRVPGNTLHVYITAYQSSRYAPPALQMQHIKISLHGIALWQPEPWSS